MRVTSLAAQASPAVSWIRAIATAARQARVA